tara:strand:+ start:9892 stop:11745 length:1854 start_codon:yes stop_codon:yes gene_type:complete
MLSDVRPQKIEFVDANYVLWKGKNEYHMRPDVCPHQGALLSEGTLEDNCIKCSYHGLKIGPYKEAFNTKSKEVQGKCVLKQGILWWAYNKNEDKSTIPFCEKLEKSEHEKKIPITRFSIDIEASFSDCFKNSMDFHHAAWVHKNTFGNYAGEPDLVAERWNTKGELEGNFLYGSNDVYAKYTGGETDNSHVYCEPSTTYNIVNGKEGKFMIIHAAMRAITQEKTKWFVTAASNFVPSGPIGRAILEKMAKKVAIEEDGKQLAKMASDAEKKKHAFKFTLPLDTIYAGWNKKYETAEELERKLDSETNKDAMALIAEKLRVYNHSVNFYPHLKNTEWLTFNSPHLFKGTKVIDVFEEDTASEITTLRNGTVFKASGYMKKLSSDIVLVGNLTGKLKPTKDSLEIPVAKMPFKEHKFKILYLSDKYLLRKGLLSEEWDMMVRCVDGNCGEDECPTEMRLKTASALESELKNATNVFEINKIANQLISYNDTNSDFASRIKNTKWLNIKHRFGNDVLLEGYTDHLTKEITKKPNGSLIMAVGTFRQMNNSAIRIDIVNTTRQDRVSSEKIEIYNPFKNESFNALYLSEQLFVRKDSSLNWNVLSRINEDEYYPIDFKGNI